ncbi:hypothetical protein IWQ56_002517 [Coemansia nantahalensis]|nr:hypothetical protein IWQ56_002517 [Coemansia nantahalensis]
MVPEILQNVIQAVNERDRGACQQIMLPGLARQFGLGMDELRSDGSTLHIEARNVRDVVVESPIWWIGPSAAYDTRVARATRGSRYLYWTNGAIVNALDKEVLRKGTRKREDIMMEVMSCPATLQLNFCMTADIEVSRTKRGKVVDCDRGTMAVPLSLSTPTYPSHRSLPVAVDGNRIIYTSRGTPPLVWRVSDVFRLVMNKELGWNLYK